MKIAIDCRMSGKSGIGSYFDSLLPFFLQNFKCLLIGKKDSLEKYSHSSNVEFIDCNIKCFSLKELIFFPKSITKKINECTLFYTPYCNIPCGIKIPIYSTIHDIVFLDITGLAGKIGTAVRKWFYQRAINRSKLIFTVSEFSKNRILHHLKCKKQIVITYNAAPKYLSENTNYEQKQNDSLLFVGNIKKHKGLSTLLDAFKIYLEKNQNARLVIVGNQDNFRTEDSTIFEKINAFSSKNIEFTGKISSEELKKIYQKSSLLVQPSLYEGFGMPVLEALVSKTNAVISDIPVFKEIYGDFPVTFFKTADAKDLAEKIQNSINRPFEKDIPQKYTFEKTFKIILKTLKTEEI